MLGVGHSFVPCPGTKAKNKSELTRTFDLSKSQSLPDVLLENRSEYRSDPHSHPVASRQPAPTPRPDCLHVLSNRRRLLPDGENKVSGLQDRLCPVSRLLQPIVAVDRFGRASYFGEGVESVEIPTVFGLLSKCLATLRGGRLTLRLPIFHSLLGAKTKKRVGRGDLLRLKNLATPTHLHFRPMAFREGNTKAEVKIAKLIHRAVKNSDLTELGILLTSHNNAVAHQTLARACLQLDRLDLLFVLLEMKLTPPPLFMGHVWSSRYANMKNMLETELRRDLTATELGFAPKAVFLNSQALPEAHPIASISRKLKVIVFSDTHSRHLGWLAHPNYYGFPHSDLRFATEVENADVVIFAGDCCNNGARGEMVKFLDWFANLPVKHKLFVPGNHDDPEVIYDWERKNPGQAGKVDVLQSSSKIIKGVKFHGVSAIPIRAEMQNNFNTTARGMCMKELVDQIPDNTDVLITHAPPFEIGDATTILTTPRPGHQGSEELAVRISELKNLRYHIFGHVHVGQGNYLAPTVNPQTLFINTSMVWQILALTR